MPHPSPVDTPRRVILAGEPPAPVPRSPRRVLPAARAIADGNGVATIRIDPDPRPRLLEALTLSTTSTGSPTVTIYVGDGRTLLDQSSGTVVPGEYHPPRLIGAGESIIVEWTGADPGAECTAARVQLVDAEGVR